MPVHKLQSKILLTTGQLTCCDVITSKYELFCYSSSHADIHLCKQLGSSFTPSVIFWEQRYLQDTELRSGNKKQKKYWNNLKNILVYIHINLDKVQQKQT